MRRSFLCLVLCLSALVVCCSKSGNPVSSEQSATIAGTWIETTRLISCPLWEYEIYIDSLLLKDSFQAFTQHIDSLKALPSMNRDSTSNEGLPGFNEWTFSSNGSGLVFIVDTLYNSDSTRNIDTSYEKIAYSTICNDSINISFYKSAPTPAAANASDSIWSLLGARYSITETALTILVQTTDNFQAPCLISLLFKRN
jgi:hypothetical protein